MLKKMNITIPELTGDEERRLYIYLPESYRWSKKKRYPVLYMFAGHNVFLDSDATYGKSWGMKNFMDKSKTQMIIVGIECNHNSEPDNSRLSEYSPFTFNDSHFGFIEGRGEETMNWIVNELKPFIDSEFRTLPDRKHTFISGSSMGGLMTVYAVVAYNHIFSRGAALSPSLWVDPAELSELIQACHMKADTVLYMDYGKKEMLEHKGMHKTFGHITNLLYNKQIMMQTRIIPHGEHTEGSWEKQLPFFISTLLYN